MEEVRAGLGRPAGADAPLEGLPTDRQALRNAMADLAGGSHPELLQRMSAAMQLSPAQLQQTAAVLQAAAQGQPVSLDSLPPELVRRAAELRRSGVVATDHLLQSMSVMVAPGSTTAAAAPHADGRECGLLDEEEGQHWLTLYRGAYLKHADVYLGPAFTATAALLLWSGTMSFWVALWLLPLLFALAVKVLLVEAAGLALRDIPTSRLPAGMVASLEAAALCTFLASMLPLLVDLWARCALLVALSSAAFYLHYRACITDPGAIPAQCGATQLPPDQLAAAQAANPYFCLSCHVYKPIRSRHCAVCNRCREELDHHCPVIANCVARGNRRCFAGYLVALLAAEALWVHLALLFHRRVLQTRILRSEELPPAWAVLRHVFALGAALPGATYATVVVAGILGGTAFLAARQLFCIASNLTTAEWLLRRRLDYLKGEDGLFYNPFDAGPVANCATFWAARRPDWFAVYSERKDLDPEVAAPAWSLSRLLRRVDQARAAMHEARARRAADREAWLLAKYAGGAGVADALEAQRQQPEQQSCRGCQGHHPHH